MTYVLGSATNTNAPPRLQHTCAGDDFFSLGRAYGVDPSVIINMQPPLAGKTLTKALVQNFVKSLAGWSRDTGIRPFSSADNPGTTDPSGNPEGYAIFTSNTQLLLPDMPRLDGKTPIATDVPPKGSTPVTVKKKATTNTQTVVVLGGLGLLLLFALSESGKKKKPATAAA